jgi:hypothetical protein
MYFFDFQSRQVDPVVLGICFVPLVLFCGFYEGEIAVDFTEYDPLTMSRKEAQKAQSGSPQRKHQSTV